MSIQKTNLPSSQHTLPDPLQSWLSGWVSKHRKGSTIQTELLTGDGSERKFYRVQLRSESLILLSDTTWTSSRDYTPHQAYLESRGVPVPRFLAEDPKVGVLLMEDLGDELLQRPVLSASTRKMPLLTKAMQVLAELHGKTFPVPASLPCFKRRFDKEKYTQEFEHTWVHLIDGFLGIGPITDKEKKFVQLYCDKIETFQPLVFCHRDFHTRNILLHNQSLFLIDFQDARMGPPHYDVASILYDPYVPLTPTDRAALFASYRDVAQTFPFSEKVRWADFEPQMKAIAFQRVIKAAGSFASFYTRFGKKTHLSYIKPALTSALKLQGELGTFAMSFPIRGWLGRLNDRLEK